MYFRIKALIIKELLAVWRDKKSRLALVAPPLLQLIIFAHAATLEARHISIGYFSQDTGWYAHELIERLKGSPYFKYVYPQNTFAQARENLNAQKIIVSLQIAEDFSRNIAANRPAVVQLILDGRKTNTSQIVLGYVSQIIANFNNDILRDFAQTETLKPTQTRANIHTQALDINTSFPIRSDINNQFRFSQAASHSPSPIAKDLNNQFQNTQAIEVRPVQIQKNPKNQLSANIQESPPDEVTITPISRSWFNPNLDYLNYNVPCLIAILSMFIAMTVTSLSVAREREMGTFDQLLVSPLQPWQILLGKMIPALLIATAEGTLIMLISITFFRIPFNGNFFLLYISLFFFIFAILGVGLFISSLAKTQQQATLGTFVFMVPTILLSGYATPVENMASWLQPLSDLMPITHFFIIIKGVFSKDASLIQVISHVWPMILISIFTLTLAGWMFGKRME